MGGNQLRARLPLIWHREYVQGSISAAHPMYRALPQKTGMLFPPGAAYIKARGTHCGTPARQPGHGRNGTTLVIATWVIGKISCTPAAESGDSRCYVYTPREKPLLPFTDDHSMVWRPRAKKKEAETKAVACRRKHPHPPRRSNLILAKPRLA